MSRFSLRTLWLPVAAVAAFLLLTWPVWRWLWSEWMTNDYYSHGVLIPPLALFLTVQRFRNDDALTLRPVPLSAGGLVLLALTLAGFLWALQNLAYYLAAYAMVGMIAGMVWLLAGLPVLRKLLFPIGYLLLMVPLPFIDRYTLPLAMFTGVCSGQLVQFLGLDVTIVGNSVTLPNADLVIGAQCSGVNSLIALTALMVLAAYVLEGSLWSRIWLVVLAVPLALLGNILRVATLLFVARAWGADAAFTFYHDYSGILFFVAVLLLMAPITRLLRFGQLRYDVI